MGASGLGSRAIIGSFYEALNISEGLGWVPRVSMPFTSDQESETYKWLGMSPVMREFVGGRNAVGFRENGLTIINKTFEATLKVLVDDLRRDKTGQVLIRIQELADRTASHWASLLSTLIVNGETSLAYDGQNFFDTDHSEGDSGDQTNDLGSGDYSQLNVGTANNPTPSELADAFMVTVQHFFKFLDDQAEPINEFASAFLVMVPVNMWGAGNTAINANLLNTGSGARDNPLKGLGVTLDIVANPRLTANDDRFYVFRTDGRAKPFIKQEEEGVTIAAIAEGSELEFQQNEHHYGVKAIRNVGYGLWQHAIVSLLS